MTAARLWRCPPCGRAFKNKNQAHSCVRYSVGDHFAGKPPVVKNIFDRLQAELEAVGPVRITAVKTSINIAGAANFAVLHVQQGGIKLEFTYDRPIESERIIRTQHPWESIFVHWVRLASPEDVDEQLIEWLRHSYNLKS